MLHWPGWLDPAARQLLHGHLLGPSTAWQQPQVQVYGRLHPVPRLVCWYGDPGCSYRYSGLCHQPLAWTPPLQQLRSLLRDQLGWDFNSLLLNRYRSGADRMGWHADDEPELAADHPIASLSLGVARPLQFRPRPAGRRGPSPLSAGQPPLALELGDGDLLLMEPPSQAHWQHGLPSRRKIAAERINLTFRRIQT